MSSTRLVPLLLSLLAAPAAAQSGTVQSAFDRIAASTGRAPGAVWLRGRTHPTLVRGRLSLPSSLEAREIAARFLTDHPELLAAPQDELREVFAQEGVHGAILRYAQHHQGLPVFGGGVSLTIDARGVVRTLGATTLPVRLPSLRPALSPDAALAFAEAGAKRPFGKTEGRGGARLGILRGHGGKARLVYKVDLPAALPFFSAPTLYVDAQDGRVVARENRIRRANRGKVYAHNPTLNPQAQLVDFPPVLLPDAGTLADAGAAPSDGGATVSDGGLVDADGGAGASDGGVGATDGGVASIDGGIATPPIYLRNERVFATNCIDRHTVQHFNFGGGQTFDMHVCDEIPKAAANADGDFVFDPILSGAGVSEDEFAEQMMYYHANVMYDFFRSMGFTQLLSSVTSRPAPLQVLANYRTAIDFSTGRGFSEASNPNGTLYPFDNAAFMAAGEAGGFSNRDNDALVFGQGSNGDYAYDADVIYHEFTHAVIASTSSLAMLLVDSFGLDPTPGGLNEGFPDFFSSAKAGDPNVGEYAGSISSDSNAPIRTLVNSNTCPGNIAGESHEDSLMWTGALWEARAALAEAQRPTYDLAVYTAMAGAPQETNFEIASDLILEQVRSRLGASAEGTVRAIYARRGVLDCHNRIEEYTAPHAMVLVEGTDVVDVSPFVPGYFQQKLTVPEGHGQVVVTFGADSLGRANPSLAALVSTDQPIQFVFDGNTIDNPGDFTQVAARGAGRNYQAVVNVPGGGDVYVMLVNTGSAEVMVQNLKLVTRPGGDGGVRDGGASDGGVVDAGVADAGASQDGGASTSDGGSVAPGGTGGGCSAGGDDVAMLGLAWLLAAAAFLMRRRGPQR